MNDRKKGPMRISIILCAGAFVLTGCAMTSDVMDAGNGTYVISGNADVWRGGETEARQLAYSDANRFCREKGEGHAVVLDHQDSAAIAGFTRANVELRFRCGQQP